MRRLLLLACLPGAMSFASALPVQYSDLIMCGLELRRRTPAELLQGYDLVIHVRIQSQSGFDHEYATRVIRGGGPGEDVIEPAVIRDVYTAHEASVLRVLKGNPNAVVEGSTQQIFERGGRVQRADHILVESVNGVHPLPIGTEWVLFLKWYEPWMGFGLDSRAGAVQIEDGKVADRVGQLDLQWRGRGVDELIEELLGTSSEAPQTLALRRR